MLEARGLHLLFPFGGRCALTCGWGGLGATCGLGGLDAAPVPATDMQLVCLESGEFG